MDFGALPPEVNSARMYSGPGSGPMLAAAAAWDGLAADLYSTATSYSSEVSGLAGQWLGPSSAAMTAAAAPYIGWMSATAAQAEQSATQARAAAAAYEAAFAMTVPPPVIAANRSLLMMLLATNFLGQNTPAIAATEAHYAEMWAQDGAAMYGYAGSSAAASQLTPFATPPQTANPLAQLAPVTPAASAAAGSAEVQGALSQLTAAVPQALQSLAAPAAAASGSEVGTSSLLGLTSLMMPLRMATMPLMMLSRLAMMGGMMGGAKTVGATTGGLGSAAGGGLPAGVLSSTGPGGLGGLGGLGTLVASGGPAAAPVSAGLGQALPVGALSVPSTWGVATPSVSLASAVTPITGGHGAFAVHPANSSLVPPVLPMAPNTGRGVGDTAPRLDPHPTVMARSPLGG